MIENFVFIVIDMNLHKLHFRLLVRKVRVDHTIWFKTKKQKDKGSHVIAVELA